MALSTKVQNSLRWIDPKPKRLVFRMLILLHGTYSWMILTQIVLGISITWTLTSSPSSRDFYYAMVVQCLSASSTAYQAFWSRKRHPLRDMHQQLLELLEKLEENTSKKGRELVNQSSKLITRATNIIIMSFIAEGLTVAIQPVSNARLPASLQGLPLTDTRIILAQIVHAVTFIPLVISAAHYLLCETRTVLFLVLGFKVLSDRIEVVKTHEDLREIVSLHSEILTIAQKSRRIFDLYNCLALCQYFMTVVLATLATIKSVIAPEIMMVIPILASFILLNCVLGDTLERASGQIFNSAYSCTWYESRLSFKKMILFVLMRSTKPANVTASILGSVCMPLSLNFFKMWYRLLQALLNIS